MAQAQARPPDDEPLDPRLHDVLRLSAGDERLSVADPLRPDQPAALDWLRELPVRLHERPQPVAGDQEHALDHRRRRPAPGAVRLRDRDDADAREGGGRLLPHRLLPARAGPAGRRDARLRLHLQPRHRAGEHDPRPPRDHGAALVQRPRLGEALARAPLVVGDRHVHDRLPRLDPRCPEAPLRVGGARRRRPIPADALGDAAERSAR